MRSLFLTALFITVVQTTVVHKGGSCGRDAIPYKITVDKRGRPELHCDSPTCIGKGSMGDARATCEREFVESVCTADAEWTAGLIESTNGTHKTLRTLCCSFDHLREAKELQTVLLAENGIFEGGSVERHGRTVAFDVVKEVRKTVGEDGAVQYIAAIYRMPCSDSSDRTALYGPQPHGHYRENQRRRQFRRRFDDYEDEYDYDNDNDNDNRRNSIGYTNVRKGNRKPSLFPENGVLPPIDQPAVQFGQNNYEVQQPLPASLPQQPSYANQVGGAEPQNQVYAASEVMTQEQTALVAPSMTSGPVAPAPSYGAQSSYASAPSYPPPSYPSPSYSYPSSNTYPTSSGCTPTASCTAATTSCCPSGGLGSVLGGLQCFSGEMVVETESGQKKISELQRGDRVLSIDEQMLQFSPVVMHLHKMDNETAEFYSVQLESGHSIELTADHLIYRSECGMKELLQLVHAKELQVGECLDVASDRGLSMHRSQIVAIEKVVRNGIYAPLTSNGDIFVNGILASCHSNYGLKTLQQTFFSIYRQGQKAYESLFERHPQNQHEVPFGVEYLSTVLDLFVPKHLF